MADLPSRAITFLFTDVEGSTRLWEQDPGGMRAALERHNALLHAAIEQHGGVVFKTVGDAFCAAFTRPADAVLAAEEAQRALLKHVPEFRVRIAVHTGQAEAVEADYLGPALNRVARLLAAGHGGQVLLSGAARDAVGSDVPEGTELRDRGSHRLKDLQQPETVYQLLHADLPSEFPPLRSLSTHPNNLPQHLTSFIGREKEMAEAKELLGRTRLLTLTGSGGTGKTRLSLQLAADLLEQFPDGIWLVELAPLSDAALVPQSVADALGLKEEPGKPLRQTLVEQLKSQHLLLILDNCEHLLDACAQLADALLRHCPKVRVLATSREGLGIAGELTYRVPSLSSPDPNRDTTPASLTHFEAVRLFIERALFHQPQFAVTNQNAPALSSVCYRLDGIPLAIELAAARVRSLSVEEVNQKLDQRFRLLTGGPRTALPRQQTLRSLIDWSYDLLNEAEKALLCRLSVFAGGWTLAAAEAVCSGEAVEEWEVLDLLTSLADKSLVVPEERGGATRYRLLETTRQYARDRLLESGEEVRLRNFHLGYFLQLAEEIQPKLREAEQVQWLGRLDAEHDNMRGALDWCFDSEASVGQGLRLAVALGAFWEGHGHRQEGRAMLEAFVRAAKRTGETRSLPKALRAASWMAFKLSDYRAAEAMWNESLAASGEAGDMQGIAHSLSGLACAVAQQGRYQQARAMFEESLDLRRELNDQAGIAAILNDLPWMVLIPLGDYETAHGLLEQSLAFARSRADTRQIAGVLDTLATASIGLGRLSEAQAQSEESRTLYEAVGDRGGVACALTNLGRIARIEGDCQSARSLFAQSLAIWRDFGEPIATVGSLERAAGVAAASGEAERAARIFGAAATVREAHNAPLAPADRAQHEQDVATARRALRDGAFAAAWSRGEAMTMEQAIAYALDEGDG